MNKIQTSQISIKSSQVRRKSSAISLIFEQLFSFTSFNKDSCMLYRLYKRNYMCLHSSMPKDGPSFKISRARRLTYYYYSSYVMTHIY